MLRKPTNLRCVPPPPCFFHFLSFSPQPNSVQIGTMHGRYGERSNGTAREKRGLDSASAEEGQPDRKRPALAR